MYMESQYREINQNLFLSLIQGSLNDQNVLLNSAKVTKHSIFDKQPKQRIDFIHAIKSRKIGSFALQNKFRENIL